MPLCSSELPAQSPNRATRWLVFAFLAAAVLWTAAMLGSLEWRYLDPFVAGAAHGRIGADFFQTPRALQILAAGNNMFLTEISDYGPYYATSYYYHPLAAIFVGPWTAPFEPWTAYWVFVGASVLMLAFQCVDSGDGVRGSSPEGVRLLRPVLHIADLFDVVERSVARLVDCRHGAHLGGADAFGARARGRRALSAMDSSRAVDLAVFEADGHLDVSRVVRHAGDAAQARRPGGDLCGGVALVSVGSAIESRQLQRPALAQHPRGVVVAPANLPTGASDRVRLLGEQRNLQPCRCSFFGLGMARFLFGSSSFL